MKSQLKPVRLGLVGCGMMGSHYADIFTGMDGVEIIACCDPTPSKLHSFGEKHGILRRYAAFHDMIGSGLLDGILNVTPDYLHSAVASASLNAALPLLTEKPLCGNLEEARGLEGLRGQTGTPVLVNFSKRHSAAVQAARKLIQNGSLGDVNRIEVSYRQGWIYTMDWGNWQKSHAWTWRLDDKFSPMGVLADLGSHIIDLVRFVMVNEFSTVSAARKMTVDKGQSRVGSHILNSTDFVEASLTLNGTVPVSLLCSRIDSGEKDSVHMAVYGSAGTLRFNLGENRQLSYLYRHEHNTTPGLLPEGVTAAADSDGGGWTAFTTGKPKTSYRCFIDVIRAADTPSPSLDDGMAVQKAMEAIWLSAESGRPTTLDSLIRTSPKR